MPNNRRNGNRENASKNKEKVAKESGEKGRGEGGTGFQFNTANSQDAKKARLESLKRRNQTGGSPEGENP